MPIMINFNICDDAKECSGIAVCPSGALFWDPMKLNSRGEMGSLNIDNSKCISCGKCVSEDGCPVNAIIYANSNEELDSLSEGYKTDINQIDNLFLERYGATPIDAGLCIDNEQANDLIRNYKGILLIEEYSVEARQGLLLSIPISAIINEIKSLIGETDTAFYRVDMSESEEDCSLPKLKIYSKSNLIGTIEGFYATSQFEKMKERLSKMFI